MLRKLLLFTFLCLSSSVCLDVVQGTTSTSTVRSSQSQGVNYVTSTVVITTIPSNVSSSLQSQSGAVANVMTTAATSSLTESSRFSAATSQSVSVSSPSSAATLSSSSAVAADSSPSSSSVSKTTSTPSTISTTDAKSLGPGQHGNGQNSKDPSYIPILAAIVSGFGLLVLLMLLFIGMALAYRHIGQKDPMMAPLKKSKKGEPSPFYSGMEPQSAQYLVSSMSNQSFASSPSDARLESHLQSGTGGVYYNRGFDVDQNPSGQPRSVVAPYESEDGFRPIQIVADMSSKV